VLIEKIEVRPSPKSSKADVKISVLKTGSLVEAAITRLGSACIRSRAVDTV
jgi:hypothetical protein